MKKILKEVFKTVLIALCFFILFAIWFKFFVAVLSILAEVLLVGAILSTLVYLFFIRKSK